MKKKILSFMLAFAFVFSVLPAGSMAVEEKSVVNGKDKKEVMEVVKSFISKAFSRLLPKQGSYSAVPPLGLSLNRSSIPVRPGSSLKTLSIT